MNRDEFDSLVLRLETRYAHRPAALRRSVMVWILAGYAFLLAWIAPLLAIGGLVLCGGASLLPAPAVWILIGAVIFAIGLIQTALLLSIRLERPKGVVVTRQSAPGLFQELDQISDSLRCRHFHRVCLSHDFGAAVWRVPRLGLFGWSEVHLSIGWPLLTSLSPPDAHAVLAHEFAHLSREHGRFGHWLYGLHQTWGRVVGELQGEDRSTTVRKFLAALIWGLNWFWPRLNARMFLLSRAAEYEADRQAAEVAGAEPLASSLWRIECLDHVLREDFWPGIRKLEGLHPEPPADMLRRMRESLSTPPEPEAARRWMTEVELALTDQTNTHPSFGDRTRALGLLPESFHRQGFPVPPRVSAAMEFFGDSAPRFEEELSAFWQRESRDAWRRRHGRSNVLNRRLGELPLTVGAPASAKSIGTEDAESDLEALPASNSPPAELPVDAGVLWEQACVLADVEGMPAAEPVLRRLLSVQPMHVYANMMLGQHLLERSPAEGIQLLRRVITSDRDDVIPQAGAMLAEYFRRIGSQEELQTIRRHMADYENESRAARKERSSVTISDTFEPHDLARHELEPLVALLKSHEELRRGWLVQKALRHFPHRRLFVLCVEAQRSGWWSGAERSSALATALIPRVRLPGQTLVIAPAGGFAGLARKVRQVPESLLYDAGEGGTGHGAITK